MNNLLKQYGSKTANHESWRKTSDYEKDGRRVMFHLSRHDIKKELKVGYGFSSSDFVNTNRRSKLSAEGLKRLICMVAEIVGDTVQFENRRQAINYLRSLDEIDFSKRNVCNSGKELRRNGYAVILRFLELNKQ